MNPCSFRLSYVYFMVSPLLCLNINLTLRITFSFQIEAEYNENALGVTNCYCNCAISSGTNTSIVSHITSDQTLIAQQRSIIDCLSLFNCLNLDL